MEQPAATTSQLWWCRRRELKCDAAILLFPRTMARLQLPRASMHVRTYTTDEGVVFSVFAIFLIAVTIVTTHAL